MSASSKKPLVIGGKLSFKGSNKPKAKVKPAPSSSSSSASASSTPATSTPPAESAATSVDTESRESSKSSKRPIKDENDGIVLTEAQKRHKQRKLEQEKREAKKLTAVAYRDRVEAFNAKLAVMTEHNDIPRISAAGNG